MPTIKNIHVTLNLDTQEGADIEAGLARFSSGERSRIIRAAILAYLRNEKSPEQLEKSSLQGPQMMASKTKAKARPDSATPDLQVTTARASDFPAETSTNHNEIAEKTKGLFDLIK